MREILLILLVSLTVNFTQSFNFYWPIYGPGRCFGEGINPAFRLWCFIFPDHYCCPRGPGNNLMLCEHIGFKGRCISHSVQVDTCVNVDIPYWASSVNTFGNCFRLYNNQSCTGKSIAVYPGLKGTDDLTKLGFNDQVVSVSNCFKADRGVDNCNGTNGWADKNCKWVIEPLTIGRLPLLRVDSNVSAPVRCYQGASNNRTEFMEASIETDKLDTGTPTNDRSRQYAKMMGRPTDDAGHVLAQRLGGSGKDLRNIFPQNATINRGVWRLVENGVYKTVRLYGKAQFTVNLVYENINATRPMRIIYRIIGGDKEQVNNISSVVNP